MVESVVVVVVVAAVVGRGGGGGCVDCAILSLDRKCCTSSGDLLTTRDMSYEKNKTG